MLSVTNPVEQTWIFSLILGVALAFSIRRRKDHELFPISVTQELKGLAILFIVFAHICFSLSNDSHFLAPLSYLAGVGVNIFLFLSGYGLTASQIKRPLNIKQFYNRRLKKLFIPFWTIIIIYFLLDWLVLNRTYPADYMVKAFAGIFQTADTAKDLDSPLWYFSFILFYYLLYPLVYIKKRPWLSAAGIFAITYFLTHHGFITQYENIRLYQVYTAAFPLGMVAAWLMANKEKAGPHLSGLVRWFNEHNLVRKSAYVLLLLSLLASVIYSRIYTTPWDSPLKAQTVNILTVFALLLFFMIKRFEMRLLYIFGIFSYEIYLIHWPLMSRYDIIYTYLPPWLGTVIYLPFLLALSWLFAKLVSFIEVKLKWK